jgi:hypothetical protein
MTSTRPVISPPTMIQGEIIGPKKLTLQTRIAAGPAREAGGLDPAAIPESHHPDVTEGSPQAGYPDE